MVACMSVPRRPGRLLLGLLLLLPVLLLGAGSSPAAGQDDVDRPVVRVGTEGTYPPFTFHDPSSNELTGYDIEVIKAVADEAGWDLEFVEAPFDSIFPALDSDRIDVIANQITINDERKARYLFSTPYTYSRGVIVTAADNDDIKTLDDIKGKTAAESETSNWAQVARDAGADVKSVDQFAQAAELLVQGRVDVIVNDNIAVLDYLASTGSKDIKIAGTAGDEVSAQALTFRQDEPDLQQQADAALEELADDGTLADISDKYFGADVTKEDAEVTDVKGSDTRSTAEVVKDAAWPMLKGLLKYSIPLTAASFAIGLVLALVTALARLSSNRLRAAAGPRLRLGHPRHARCWCSCSSSSTGWGRSASRSTRCPAAILALSLNVGGYAAEIIRASILSVPRGQYEAATTIGMALPAAAAPDRAAAGGADRRTAPVQHAAVPDQGHVARRR